MALPLQGKVAKDRHKVAKAQGLFADIAMGAAKDKALALRVAHACCEGKGAEQGAEEKHCARDECVQPGGKRGGKDSCLRDFRYFHG